MPRQIIQTILVVYVSWLGMMLTHELGHVLHALLSGGHVVSVSVPLLGFSQTLVAPNPHELLVVWGGPIWGVVIPTLITVASRMRKRRTGLLEFFAGFCQIANGAYVGAGCVLRAGDAREMLRLGTPVWVMVVFGAVCVSGGLWWWHRMGARIGRGQRS